MSAPTSLLGPTRPATPPGKGAARDAVIALLVAAAAGYVTSQTGSPEAGQAAGAAVQEYVLPLVFGGLMGASTYARKWMMNRLSQ